MPYELEYKKVHNTLSKAKNTNHYGYLKGDRITPIDISKRIALGDIQDTEIMVQSHSSAHYIQIAFYESEDSQTALVDPVDFSGTHYVLGENCIECSLNNNESFLIKIPASKEFYNATENRLIKPSWIKITAINSDIFWFTQNNVWSIEENQFINGYIINPIYDNLTWNEDTLLENIQEAISNATYNYDTSTNTFTAQNLNVTQSNLDKLNLSLVLVPCKYYSENNQKLQNKIKPLRSITNTRNSKQSSLYDEYWSPASAYIEPIVLNIINNTTSMSFDAPAQILNSPLYDEKITTQQDMKVVQSLRGQQTYALENASKTLILCQGCGYDSGLSAGNTYITFGIGLQYVRPINPHSGTDLQYLYITGITPIELKRLPLASKNAAIHPIILKKSQ